MLFDLQLIQKLIEEDFLILNIMVINLKYNRKTK